MATSSLHIFLHWQLDLPNMAVPEDVDLDALNYVVKVPYNGTGATGGDSMTENLNIWYEVSQRFCAS